MSHKTMGDICRLYGFDIVLKNKESKLPNASTNLFE